MGDMADWYNDQNELSLLQGEIMDDKEMYEINYDKKEHETDKAWLFIFEDKKVWLPKSQCELDELNKIINVPVWLVEEKEIEDYIV